MPVGKARRLGFLAPMVSACWTEHVRDCQEPDWPGRLDGAQGACYIAARRRNEVHVRGTRKRSLAWAVAGIALATLIEACAPRASPSTSTSQAPRGSDCLAACTKHYKECAYGQECMMVQECILRLCIPSKEDCERNCAAVP